MTQDKVQHLFGEVSMGEIQVGPMHFGRDGETLKPHAIVACLFHYSDQKQALCNTLKHNNTNIYCNEDLSETSTQERWAQFLGL